MARRDTDPDSPGVAAWGDPAVIARCGVAALGPTDTECLEVDGVGWIPDPLSDGTRFTSFGTDPALEVLVPKAYAPEPLLLPVFAPGGQGPAVERARLPLGAPSTCRLDARSFTFAPERLWCEGEGSGIGRETLRTASAQAGAALQRQRRSARR